MSYTSNVFKVKLHAFFLGLRAFLPIIFLFFQSKDLTFTQIALIIGAFGGSTFLFEIPSGVFADRVGRKYSLMVSSLAIAIGPLVMAHADALPLLLLGAFIFGIGEAFQSGADAAVMYDSLKTEKKQKEYAKHFGQRWSYFLAALAIGSLSVSIFPNFIWAFYLASAGGIVSFFIALTIKEPPITKKVQDSFSHFKESLSFTWNHQDVKRVVIAYIVILLGLHILFDYIQFFMRDVGIPTTYNGALYTFFILLAALTSHYANRIDEKLGEKKSLAGMLFLVIIAATIISLQHTIALTLLAIIIAELTFGYLMPITSHYIQDYVSSHHRATVNSIKSFGYSIAMVIFTPIFGLIADTITYRNMTKVLAVVLLLILIYPKLKQVIRFSASEL